MSTRCTTDLTNQHLPFFRSSYESLVTSLSIRVRMIVLRAHFSAKTTQSSALRLLCAGTKHSALRSQSESESILPSDLHLQLLTWSLSSVSSHHLFDRRKNKNKRCVEQTDSTNVRAAVTFSHSSNSYLEKEEKRELKYN